VFSEADGDAINIDDIMLAITAYKTKIVDLGT
jgi:hypothetical protein